MEKSSLKSDGQFAEMWRKLGYYCGLDEKSKAYRFIGSPTGLLNFCMELDEYVEDETNEQISEHIHLTPYMYLEIMTWHEPIIDEHAIAGTLEDLKRLSVIIHNYIRNKENFVFLDENIGKEIILKDEYTSNGDWSIILDIKHYGFDPARADKAIPKEVFEIR